MEKPSDDINSLLFFMNKKGLRSKVLRMYRSSTPSTIVGRALLIKMFAMYCNYAEYLRELFITEAPRRLSGRKVRSL